jgi:shikimate dehydrogenase
MRITGKTKIMFILADAVDHIVGSDVLNRAFEENGLDIAVSPLSVAPPDLEQTVATIRRLANVIGFGVTIPHKIEILCHVDDLTEAARAIGAVNFVRREGDGRLVGHNVDGEGFVAGLGIHDVTIEGANILQIGAGGVGRAIAYALAQAGAASITLVNRKVEKADDLAATIRATSPRTMMSVHASEEDLPDAAYDLIVNTTSLGMHAGDPLPVSLRRITSETTVAEVIMKPSMTPLLADAERLGVRMVPGMAMMQPQAHLVAHFLGMSAA